ncbi:MAG: signal peptidase II [Dehalococcoidales bacterium]|jgi:signal peptidase II|nr:signal peptidase II [Dehalococcoidales bacterium]
MFRVKQARWNLIVFAIAAAVIALDQLTKFWIRHHLALGQSWPDDGILRLTYVQNTGAAFSIFYGKSDILTVVSIIGVIVLLIYVFIIYRRYTSLDTPVNRISLGLILGGTIGNLIDRLAFYGHVTDFIDIGPWPVFNIADSSTVTGVIIFALSLLLADNESKKTYHL